MSEHPDFEALSAYYDGEAAEVADHVGRCEACQAELSRIAAVSGAVGAPAEPLSVAAVDGMIGRALAGDDGADTAGGRAAVVSIEHRSRNRWAVLVSAAAAVVVAIGLVGYLARTDDGNGRRTDTALAPAPTVDQRLGAPSVAGNGTTSDSLVEGANLGEVADGRALVEKVGPEVNGPSAAAAAATDNPVVAPPNQAQGPSGSVGGVKGPQEVGTRACELQARSIDPGAGPLAYVASATQGGAPATVLGFAPPGGGRPLSLFLMAQDGCRLLARANLP